MGMFNINMPILHGEDLDSAFKRLQHNIISESDDQSVLAWFHETYHPGPLASTPSHFRSSGSVRINRITAALRTPFSITNIGLRITLCIAKNSQNSPCFSGGYLENSAV